MSNRCSVRCVLVIGSGPIVIGQGCEFDYSGTQAIRALREEGIRVVLLNSNPATIMTDPELSDATYIEPLTVDSCMSVIEKEHCDAILPTLGGQTALNLACELSDRGEVDRLGIQLLGVNLDAIRSAEDRRSFRQLALDAGCEVPRSAIVKSTGEAITALDHLGLPLIVRPSFTLGGSGAGLARDRDTFLDVVECGIHRSPISEVLLEESVEGWKEFELEVMRDGEGNCVVICSIENLDPMGTHTGDSITVAPVQTLSDKDYQRMRDAAFKIMELVGISGGANVQFALQPDTGRLLVIEMNPRVSRSSALASKATGYPIAKIATKLALGYALHELPNDIVGSTPASFEPALDYCVVKIPRWNFEKFKGACDDLSPQMKSVGEVLALGRTFNEALQKALRSLEAGLDGLEENGNSDLDDATLRSRLRIPNPERLLGIKAAYARGWSTADIHELTMIDVWFLENIHRLTLFENELRDSGFPCDREVLLEAKRCGFGDRQLAGVWGVDEDAVAAARVEHGIQPAVRMVDTCAAEFAAKTPYFYMTYGERCEVLEPGRVREAGRTCEAGRVCEAGAEDEPCEPGRVRETGRTCETGAESVHGIAGAGDGPRRPDRSTPLRKVMILGSGPNRIGQGIEFDYCCVHAALELQSLGIETIMVNCNPETVSTDFDVSTRLYFEPVTFEHVMGIVEKEKPDGVIVQFGGQTPLKLLHRLHAKGVPVLGTAVESVDRAEDRKRCSELLTGLGVRFPASTFASNTGEGVSAARRLGFPLLLRPPYVLGGMDMELVYDEDQFEASLNRALRASDGRPLMLDRFIESATEVDVDVISDGANVVTAGVMEHIEEAGIHSGDSSCVLPPVSLEDDIVRRIEDITSNIARELSVVGMLNVQYAVKDDTIYCIEINPRASRTVPFVSKATGIPWVKLATRAILGLPIEIPKIEINCEGFFSVKAPVLPFDKFPGVDSLLGPEMHATGEVMGIAPSFGEAFIKGQMAAGFRLRAKGKVFISVANRFKRECVFPAKTLVAMGHSLVATSGTAKTLRSYGIPVDEVPKVSSGDPRIIDLIDGGDVVLVVNTPVGKTSIEDERAIRLAAIQRKVPCITTMQGFHSLVLGLETLQGRDFNVAPLQEYVRRCTEVVG